MRRVFARGAVRERSSSGVIYREPVLDPGCKLGAHRRLLDAHTLWHQTAAGYEDAGRFRANLNAAIQALRSVTFVLQTEKDTIDDFDRWYAPWQAALKDDAICTWLNDARVQVFHLADLEVNSRARVSLVLDPEGERQALEFDMAADAPLAEVTAQTRQIIAAFGLERGFAIVERRWVANDLPDVELLDALAHCYEVLDGIVSDAHGHLKTDAHFMSAEKLECMTHGLDARAHRFDVVTGKRMRFEAVTVELTPGLAEAASHRYGPLPQGAARTSREFAEQIVDFSKRILVRDGNHHPMLWLWRRDGRISMSGLVFGDSTDKLAHWERVAKEVARIDAIALIFVAEAWTRAEPGGRPTGELLNVFLATEDGGTVSWATRFTRRFGRIRLEDTSMPTQMEPLFLEPVMKVWRDRSTNAAPTPRHSG